jgi:hypothetical protein
MKKVKFLFGAVLLFMVCFVTSCEKLSGCERCKNVTYENGLAISSSSETEYCGSDLIAKKAIPDITVGSLTTKVECR